METLLLEIFYWRVLAIFLMIVAMFGILLGLLLIIRPQQFEPINQHANRWISLRWIGLFFDRSVRIEHFFYRHHRIMGSGIVFAAGYVFVYFGALFDKKHAITHLDHFLPMPLLDAGLDALVLSLLIGATMVLLVGIFLGLRPSLLRNMEEEVNRWISFRQATKFLDVSHYQLEFFMQRHLRRVGWLLLLVSLYLLFILFRLLV